MEWAELNQEIPLKRGAPREAVKPICVTLSHLDKIWVDTPTTMKLTLELSHNCKIDQEFFPPSSLLVVQMPFDAPTNYTILEIPS